MFTLRVVSIILAVLTSLFVFVLNSLSPAGTGFTVFYSIIGIFLLSIGLVLWKSPKKISTYILIAALMTSGTLLSLFQYRSEILGNYNEESWKKEREYQVYRLNNLVIERDIKNLSENEIQGIFGIPEKIEEKDGEKKYTYVYEGVWGIHEWTDYFYVYFDKNGMSYEHGLFVIDAVDDRENLKSPRY